MKSSRKTLLPKSNQPKTDATENSRVSEEKHIIHLSLNKKHLAS